ncbi:MAG: DUF192 domain-containing protein [Roseiflexus sp.]|nr:DUF192 domain-containing protein [Roseiflexus sp.]MCS7290161.1 DUF192 domain-containing protein [Roseiflexus sp.]MDW8148770.1 DUF192 domain-containing protein [Roseiflexaceae bacterium]MDW8232616.1 DUF192 domain-containing protein [Roseiflexaceae bacterium]
MGRRCGIVRFTYAVYAWLVLLLLVAAACSQARSGDALVMTTAAPSLASGASYPAPTGAAGSDAYLTPEAAYPAPAVAIITPQTAGAAAPEATVVPDAIIEIVIGEHRLEAEVVATPEKRSIGLMFRDALPENRGMLFVFPGPYSGAFWMRNTRIPLSIAFISQERRILNIEDMQPFDEVTQHAPRGVARYALEVNQGWFAARGIRPGDEVVFELPPDLVIR